MKTISPDEILSRYIFNKKYFSIEKNIVRYNTFMPNPKNGETSVFRTSELDDDKIWDIGKVLEKLRDKTNIGRTDIIASVVLSKNLEIIPSEPPPLHADIKNWPNEKSEQKLIAMELAQESKLFLKNGK